MLLCFAGEFPALTFLFFSFAGSLLNHDCLNSKFSLVLGSGRHFENSLGCFRVSFHQFLSRNSSLTVVWYPSSASSSCFLPRSRLGWLDWQWHLRFSFALLTFSKIFEGRFWHQALRKYAFSECCWVCSWIIFRNLIKLFIKNSTKNHFIRISI